MFSFKYTCNHNRRCCGTGWAKS